MHRLSDEPTPGSGLAPYRRVRAISSEQVLDENSLGKIVGAAIDTACEWVRCWCSRRHMNHTHMTTTTLRQDPKAAALYL